MSGWSDRSLQTPLEEPNPDGGLEPEGQGAITVGRSLTGYGAGVERKHFLLALETTSSRRSTRSEVLNESQTLTYMYP